MCLNLEGWCSLPQKDSHWLRVLKICTLKGQKKTLLMCYCLNVADQVLNVISLIYIELKRVLMAETLSP